MFYKLPLNLLFFQKDSVSNEKIKQVLEEKEDDLSRIRCPICKWQPKASSRWYCGDCGHPEYFFNSCGAYWNTFETKGKCPGCMHQWRNTSCLYCGKWSLHEDWYGKELD